MRNEYAMKYAYEGIQYQPGEDLHRTRYYVQHPRNDLSEERIEDFRKNPGFFRERWWDDGSILAGGREFTAITETGCYTRGEMSCLSCHSMHHSDPNDQLKPGMRGDLACTQCHKEALYSTDIEKHSHHPAGSDGSRCQNCHMPYNTYALLGAIRSHQIETPRIHGSIQHGVPNACNLCHLDQTLEWTQSNMAKWYGTTQQAMSDEQKEISAALLWILKGDAAQRAVTAWNFGWKPAQKASGVDWEAPFIARLLEDPYGVVRYVAENALRSLPGFTHLKFDFLSSKENLKKHTEQVVKQWSSLRKDFSQPANAKVLLLEGGAIDEVKVQEILRKRDNRKVVIKE
jgi:predicted CXXCH cytochrome family protein